MNKKAYRHCPRPSGCVWDTYARTGEHLCMLSVCPYTAISDGARELSPVESENASENRIDGSGSGCEDE